jgi:ankyrin repeat protein
MASKNGHPKVVQVLLDCGADISAREKGTNQTPLDWALTAGHLEVTSILLEHGAGARAEDDSNQTPLHPELLEGDYEII